MIRGRWFACLVRVDDVIDVISGQPLKVLASGIVEILLVSRHNFTACIFALVDAWKGEISAT